MTISPEEDKSRLPPLENHDCVLRSLESVTGVSATPTEREFRRNQIVIHRERFAGLADGPTSLSLLIQAVEAERENVRSLVEHITHSNSPLGLALRGLSISEEDIYPKRAAEMIQNGEQLILLATYHAAHLGIGANPSKFISLSDGNEELLLEPWHRIHILRLTPKLVSE
ncbi:MAG: hypothetical protein ACOY0S_02055 [Patescibacteria group bacterium]